MQVRHKLSWLGLWQRQSVLALSNLKSGSHSEVIERSLSANAKVLQVTGSVAEKVACEVIRRQCRHVTVMVGRLADYWMFLDNSSIACHPIVGGRSAPYSNQPPPPFAP